MIRVNHLANKGFLSGVDARVRLQITFRDETFLADLARVLSVVDARVGFFVGHTKT